MTVLDQGTRRRSCWSHFTCYVYCFMETLSLWWDVILLSNRCNNWSYHQLRTVVTKRKERNSRCRLSRLFTGGRSVQFYIPAKTTVDLHSWQHFVNTREDRFHLDPKWECRSWTLLCWSSLPVPEHDPWRRRGGPWDGTIVTDGSDSRYLSVSVKKSLSSWVILRTRCRVEDLQGR